MRDGEINTRILHGRCPGYAWGLVVVLGRWAISYERGSPAGFRGRADTADHRQHLPPRVRFPRNLLFFFISTGILRFFSCYYIYENMKVLLCNYIHENMKELLFNFNHGNMKVLLFCYSWEYQGFAILLLLQIPLIIDNIFLSAYSSPET